MTAKTTLATLTLCLLMGFGPGTPPALAEEPGEDAKAPDAKPVVAIETNVGTIEVELWPDVAPRTVENFLQYVDDGFYDGTIFHRVIEGFMIQGGGFTPDGQRKKTRAPIPLEAKASNDPYTIAMARTGNPDSATAQFFINLVDNAGLDARPGNEGYAVFGKVVKGSGVVKHIGSKPVKRGRLSEAVPLNTITIESIRRVDG